MRIIAPSFFPTSAQAGRRVVERAKHVPRADLHWSRLHNRHRERRIARRVSENLFRGRKPDLTKRPSSHDGSAEYRPDQWARLESPPRPWRRQGLSDAYEWKTAPQRGEVGTCAHILVVEGSLGEKGARGKDNAVEPAEQAADGSVKHLSLLSQWQRRPLSPCSTRPRRPR
jgi:hypothetical protein